MVERLKHQFRKLEMIIKIIIQGFKSLLLCERVIKLILEEAIIHAKEVAESNICKECKDQHQQLADWLKELKQYKEKNKEKITIYPGSFDPITYGHLDIIKRISNLFDKVIVLIGNNSSKKYMFSVNERKNFINKCIEDEKLKNILVSDYDGLIVDFAKENKSFMIIKGLRNVSDYEYELNMAYINEDIEPEIETLFMVANPKLSMVSSSMVKEIAKYNKPINKYVNDFVEKEIIKKLNEEL